MLFDEPKHQKLSCRVPFRSSFEKRMEADGRLPHNQRPCITSVHREMTQKLDFRVSVTLCCSDALPGLREMTLSTILSWETAAFGTARNFSSNFIKTAASI